MTIFRADRGGLASPKSSVVFEGVAGRVHVNGDGLMYSTGPEYRDIEEVQRIADQLVGIPVFWGHPDVPASKSGWTPIGKVIGSRVDDDKVVAEILITNSEYIDKIKGGTSSLSLGYKCTLDDNRFQRNVQLDHLSIVDRPRCGPVCSMKTDEESTMKVEMTASEELKQVLDSVVAEIKATVEASKVPVEAVHADCTCKNHAIVHNNGESMETVTKEEFDAVKAKLDEASKKLTELEVDATNARKDAEVATAKVAALEAAVEEAKSAAAAQVAQAKKDAADAIASEMQVRVDARVALVTEAGKILKDTDLSKLSDREIKCAVIKHVDGDEVSSEKSIDYVTGVYEGALKRAVGAAVSRETIRTTVNDMRKDNAPVSGVDAEKAAKEKMHRESATAWASK